MVIVICREMVFIEEVYVCDTSWPAETPAESSQIKV